MDPVLTRTRHNSGDRIANLLLAVSFPALGLAHFFRSEAALRVSPVMWTVLALSCAVGVLFARRASVRREPPWQLIVVALPALAIPAWVELVTPPVTVWPLYAELVFAVGGAATGIALATLGKSFAILPAVRAVVTTGPYRVVRHPAYGGELVMLFACLVASPTWVTLLPLVAGVPLVALRILAEEKLLRDEPEYARYAARVHWRLVPYVW